MSFKIFEHTADLGIDATGDTAGECLGSAAQALAHIATGRDVHTLHGEGELQFTVEAPDLPSLAVAFLSEVLWFLESESTLWVAGGAEVEQVDGMWRAQAAANAVVYEPSKHGQGTEIKAITYHELVFERQKRWHLRVIVDI